jgi:hypothetical protein
MAIDFPVYFVTKEIDNFQDVVKDPLPPSSDEIFNRLRNGSQVWAIQTYINLKRRSNNVRLSREFIPGEICVAHYDDIYIKDFPYDSYIVAIQADRPDTVVCEQRVVQNLQQVNNAKTHFIPLWAQPGLVPRDPSRETRVENVAYFGRSVNLSQDFLSDGLKKELLDCGINLILDEKNWHNYQDVDVVWSVRDSPETLINTKPPSKLINAWLAGCPAILSPDPANMSLRKSENDFLIVRSPNDFISALKKLKDNPKLFEAMVKNGKMRSKEFNQDGVSEKWEKYFTDVVYEDYLMWKKGNSVINKITRMNLFVIRSVIQMIHRKTFFSSRKI